MSAGAKPIGWVNEAGILFPLASYNPETANYLCDHKKGWKHVYGQATVDQLQAEVAELREELGLFSPSYFAATSRAAIEASSFGAGMPDLRTDKPGVL